MSQDHLDREVAVFGELTERGIKGGAKSRAISSIDRLLGSAVDVLSAPLEGVARRERARQDAQVALIAALGEQQLQQLHDSPDFAEQALKQHLKITVRREENKKETVRLAIEDLQSTPPSDDQSNAGSDELDPDFLNRFERYAEDATSEQLRERWGRVLASEIRSPGTFSGKVMRVVDELDASTAAAFERLCAHRIGDAIPKILAGKLSFSEATQLVNADLILDPDGGHIRLSVQSTLTDGAQIWLLKFEDMALSLPIAAGVALPYTDEIRALSSHQNKPVVPVYLLTPAGRAIASILPSEVAQSMRILTRSVSTELPDDYVHEFRQTSENNFSVVATFVAGQQSS